MPQSWLKVLKVTSCDGLWHKSAIVYYFISESFILFFSLMQFIYLYAAVFWVIKVWKGFVSKTHSTSQRAVLTVKFYGLQFVISNQTDLNFCQSFDLSDPLKSFKDILCRLSISEFTKLEQILSELTNLVLTSVNGDECMRIIYLSYLYKENGYQSIFKVESRISLW